MKSKKKTKVKTSLLFVKNKSLNFVQVSKQTSKMRDITNAQIRDLGIKYYRTKSLFDKLKFSRDYLFYIGRQIENEYRNSKKMVHLQTQQCPMKESLVCWFAMNFYDDIFSNQSDILYELIRHSSDKEFTKSRINNKTDNSLSHQIISDPNQAILASNNSYYLDENYSTLNQDDNEENINVSERNSNDKDNKDSIFHEIKFNHEIDDFSYGNIRNENIEEIINQNNNFCFS